MNYHFIWGQGDISLDWTVQMIIIKRMREDGHIPEYTPASSFAIRDKAFLPVTSLKKGEVYQQVPIVQL